MNVSDKVSIGVIGAAGYTGGELLRIAVCHPNLTISFAHSHSFRNKPICAAHPDLIGLMPNMTFTDQVDINVDVIFLCVGHGQAAPFLADNSFSDKTIIIDLSQDHRLNNLDGFVYGLCDGNHNEISKARKIANPGCFATAIQLALYPFAYTKELSSEVHVTAITGSTGAGYKPSKTTHFSWRANNLSVYKSFDHQHLLEINQQLGKAGWKGDINMIPVRGSMTRGIIVSSHFKSKLDEGTAKSIMNDYYSYSSFIHIVDNEPDLKSVINTNNCLISVKKHGKYIHIVSIIDNLIKGASCQAIQNLNLIKGWDESSGLRLKPVAF